MKINEFIYYINIFFFVYMFLYAIVFFFTTILASFSLDDFFTRKRHMSNSIINNNMNYIPISILVPAYNEEITIIDTIESLLSLDYPEYEIVIINDGSKDRTEEVVIEHFKLKEISRPIRRLVPCKEMKHVYENDNKVKIVLVSKDNGGKSDALNMGINVSRFPLFVCVDADSMLQYDSLKKIVEPFLESDDVIAVGGNIKVANQVLLDKGRVIDIKFPKKKVVIFQSIEYLRVFLNSRVAFNGINSNLIVSGAFGIYKKQAIINVGGYSLKVVGEDMEIIVKLHAFYRKNKLPYKIEYVPDAICWTQVPEQYKILRNQRRRWHIGLGESLKNHWFMNFNPKYGTVGLIAYPYFFIFEYITPLLEILGIGTISISFLLNIIDTRFFLLYLLVYMGYNMIISIIAILLEKCLFGKDTPINILFKQIAYCMIESFGYRQICSLYRLGAFNPFRKKEWGHMVRTKQHGNIENLEEAENI